ncbi:MAG: hypothetical protein PHP88_06675 [bacterium]|nr:hypothetical protein [bacterium]
MTATLKTPKRSAEAARLSIGFKYRLAKGDVITGITSFTIADSAGVDKSAEMIRVGTSQVDPGGRSVSAVFTGGSSGQTYTATARVTTANGETLEGQLLIPVSDG